MKAIETPFKELVRRHRETVPSGVAPSEITGAIREELAAIEEQTTRLEPDDEIVRQALARIAGLVLAADVEWYRD